MYGCVFVCGGGCVWVYQGHVLSLGAEGFVSRVEV